MAEEENKEAPLEDGQVSEEVAEENVETLEGEKLEVEAKPEEAEKELTETPEEVASAPAEEAAKPAWWEERGFKSEEAALKSSDELRAHATKTSMENAKLKVREETYRKVSRGELEHEEAENFIRDEEDRLEGEAKKKSDDESLWAERRDAAIEVGKIKYPDIVTPENMPVLDAFFRNTVDGTPLQRLEQAVQMFKQVRGPSAEIKKNTKEAQDKMKDLAGAVETPTGKHEEAEKDAWAMSDEEFRQQTQKVRFGAP